MRTLGLKDHTKAFLNFLHLDVTKNLRYDRLTKSILKSELNAGSNCIDVGCHAGEILDIMFDYAPNGQHFGFEPIPSMYEKLQCRYGTKASILPFALSDENGSSTFQVVKNAPAYSGLKQRQYAISNPEIEEIEVEVRKLDDVVPLELPIHLVKIDVEGGEFGVLKGGLQLLRKWKPTLIFESGLGASDFYETDPKELFNFIREEIGLQLYTLQAFCKKAAPLTLDQFLQHYKNGSEYYFVAHV